MSIKHRLIVALVLCPGIILIGAMGYMLIEDYTILDGIYMSVITITTVGYGEVKPLSEIGRGFTIFLILIGFGILAFAGHAVVELLFERAWSDKAEIKKMKKQISKLKSHYIICGFGRVGKAASEHFKAAGVDFVIIEANPDQSQIIREKGYLYIEGDATWESVLSEARIKSAKGLLALLNADPDNLFIVLSARELNPTLHIIARAEDISSEKKIFRAGADSVVSPFATAGKQIAGNILTATGKYGDLAESFSLPEAVPQWLNVQHGSEMIDETVRAFSDQMGREVIGIRRNGKDTIFPDTETMIETGDMLLLVDEKKNIDTKQERRSSTPPKLVIVDDNPVILRLYTRLFQKAGFYPITATNGRDGLDLIIRERPVAAVIDYMLPVMSGIEVCDEVRKIDVCQETKLILFTADNQPETHKNALNAGADVVVVKSPEASEVIEIVIKTIRAAS